MDAGPELDALVAEKVMGWGLFQSSGETWACCNAFCNHGSEKYCQQPGHTQGPGDRLMFAGHAFGFFKPGWSASTNIVDAWEVVEHMEQDGWRWLMESMLGKRACTIWLSGDDDVPQACGRTVEATMPHAICLAALKAKGISR